MSKLTIHQKEKFNEIFSLIKKEEKKILLKGSAGVGKTWLVNSIVSALALRVKPYRILCSAPTHKALAVIKSKVQNEEIKFKTVHSVLQYKSVIDPETGERTFKSDPSDKWPPLKHIAYWIIDEASMIDTEMLKTIEKHAKIQGTVVIFVGDGKQLNPVGEQDSPVFMQGYPEVELTEIIRQGEGNPIIYLSRNIPKIWDKTPLTIDSDEGIPEGYLYTQNLAKIIEELARVNGTDEFKYLAWTNKEVDKINTLVRNRIYGDSPAKIELEETIVFKEPYKKYTTNEELKVEQLEEQVLNKRITLKDTNKETITEMVKFEVYYINKEILVLKDSSLATYKKYLAIINKNCKEKSLSYEEKAVFMSIFASFQYNHAITVHKSQGSTYKTTVLNLRDINLNQNLEEKQRLLYTGVTRASELLILYNL
jgi:ATP-dependent exoDNAse (exonuclease V) alpha subunit